MKFRVTGWVVIEDVLHKPPKELELDEAVAQPLVARGYLEPVADAEAAAAAPKSKPAKADQV